MRWAVNAIAFAGALAIEIRPTDSFSIARLINMNTFRDVSVMTPRPSH